MPSSVFAVDEISLSVFELYAEKWHLQGVKLQYAGLGEAQQSLGLGIEQLHLPPPLQDLSFVDINCLSFELKPDLLTCQRGFALLKMPGLDAAKIPFSFRFDKHSGLLEVNKLGVMQGVASLTLHLKEKNWNLMVSGQGFTLARLSQFIDLGPLDISSGQFGIQANLKGNQTEINHINVNLFPRQVAAQTQDGLYAVEALDAEIELDAENRQSQWQWQGQVKLSSGGLFVNPVYLDLNALGSPTISVQAKGEWNQSRQQLRVTEARFNHQSVLAIHAKGDLWQQSGSLLSTAQIRVESNHLDAVSDNYLQPFLEGTGASGMVMKGSIQANLQFKQQQAVAMAADFESLQLLDQQQRIELQGGNGTLYWNRGTDFKQVSDFGWSSLKVLGVIFDAAELSVILTGQQVKLAEPVKLPLFDGNLTIEQLDYHQHSEQPDIHFKGIVDKVSLEEATEALGVLPLSGSISGQIPGIHLEAGKLSLDGELLINLFDGQITVKELAASNLFSYLPRFYADFEIDNLDLNELTKKFSFGYIEGRLSGRISNLYMENWQPVTFYAWLGTPEGDDSTRIISQKAVKNIVSIGGGSAADLFSRGFLRFFEDFGYKQLGFGCYLYQGVCQLMGVEAVRDGYYIVKGGGLPRINVIGYNSRIDWNVLLQRLKRLSVTDQAVVR